MRMNSVLTAVLFLAWFIRRAARQAWLLGIPRSRHHNTRIPANRSDWLARLSYNRKVDFCCIQSRCRDLFKASQPGWCDQGLSSIFRFYVLSLDRFFKVPRANTKFQPPSKSYPLLYINWSFPYPRSLHKNIIKNNRKTILNRKPNNV